MPPTLSERVQRVRVSIGLATQAAVAAGIAWYVAHNLLGHIQPFFAPIAAVVTLATSVGQRMRRAVELVAGNACGILLGEGLILVIGRGTWQISLVVFLAILLALFLGGTASLVAQAANSGALVASLLPLGPNYFFSRFVDAVVGGVVALVVMALVLPLNPLTVVARAANPMLESIAARLSETARALEDRDAEQVRGVLTELRDAEDHLRAFKEAIPAGREIATVAPLRWHKRGELAQYVESYDHIARTLRNSRVLVRRSVQVLADGEPLPPQLIVAVHALAESVSWLRRELGDGREPEASRESALAAVRAAGRAYLAGVGFSGSVIVAQVRSIGLDLLRAGGLTPEEADRLVMRAIGKAAGPIGRKSGK